MMRFNCLWPVTLLLVDVWIEENVGKLFFQGSYKILKMFSSWNLDPQLSDQKSDTLTTVQSLEQK